jgi:tyrosinase
MGIRRAYRTLSIAEQDNFIQALKGVKERGLVDAFADIHVRHFSMGIHRSSHFLPWHREFILRFEEALQEEVRAVDLPYWDSTVDNSPSDPLWNPGFLGQFNAAWGLGRALGSDVLPTAQQVQTNQGRGTYDAFWPELELDIHNPPHRWVGGMMARAASPLDPVFYLHHAWIDMLWALWQQRTNAPFVASSPGLGLNDPLMEWPDRTPADVLNIQALGYSYDVPSPARRISLGAINYPGCFVRHRNFLAELTTITTDLDLRDATFVERPGLNDPRGGVSFEASNYPGYYLRHQEFRLKLQKNDASALFLDDATFIRTAPLFGSTGNSYRSKNYPDRCLRHRDFHLVLDPVGSATPELQKKDSTFLTTVRS